MEQNTQDWVSVPSFPNYKVNKGGEIISVSRGKPIKIKKHKNKHGYEQVHLYKNNKSHTMRFHRVMARVFLGLSKKEHLYVNHIDGDKLNNKLKNLEICTAKENTSHAIKNGLFNPCGEDNSNSKTSKEELIAIKVLLKKHVKRMVIAELLCMPPSRVSKIIKSKAWKEL